MHCFRSRGSFLLILGLVPGLLLGFRSHAQSVEPDGADEEAAIVALHQGDEGQAQEYWGNARQELFDGIDLSEDQKSQIDSILDKAAADRELGRQYETQLREAQRNGDAQLSRDLHKRLRAVNARSFPRNRIKAMAAVLASRQVERFEINRRLRVERLAPREEKAREGVQMHPGHHRRGGGGHHRGHHQEY